MPASCLPPPAYRLPRNRHSSSRRSGMILVTAMFIIVILGAVALFFARSTKVEVIAAGNRMSAHEASAIEQGAEQYVLSLIDQTTGDAVSITQAAGEALPIGDGYFWILRTDPDNDSAYDFGITDEAGKLSLNNTTSLEMMKLPGMTQEFADSITDWVDTDSTVTGQGGEDTFYMALSRPYHCKNGPLESIEELMLVKGYSDDILWGNDLNHNGVLEDIDYSNPNGMSSAVSAVGTNGDSTRGIFPFITVNSIEPNTDSYGNARVSVNPAAQAGAGGARRPTPVPGAPGSGVPGQPAAPGAPGQGAAPAAQNQALRTALLKQLPQQRVDQIMAAAGSTRFTSVLDFAIQTKITSTEFAKVVDLLTLSTTAKTMTGLINVNTAPRQVLLCLQGMTQSDADTIVAKRVGADTSTMAWVIDALPATKLDAIAPRLTGRSFQYSADIVAISGDGRAFKRVRIVVDARKSPARVLYRKDLTSLGWPLTEDIRTSLRQGNGTPATTTVPHAMGTTSGTSSMH